MSEATKASLRGQGGFFITQNPVERACDAAGDSRLYFLDVDRIGEHNPDSRLAGLRLIVIGAGPAGLVLARNASLHGADVIVLEQAGDPRRDDAGYTNRSFNITLDNVGRQVLGDPRAWSGGIWLKGRAVHNFKGTTDTGYALYGSSKDAELISLPRPLLRQNLCMLAAEAGARLQFHARVTSADPDAGVVSYRTQDGEHEEVSGDLIVFSDGLHSLANGIASSEAGIKVWPEPRSYVSGMIVSRQNKGLSLGHIHFWHEPVKDNFTVGIPNADGSVALLIVSLFEGLDAGDNPFATPGIAARRLRHEFPRLFEAAPHLARQLPAHRRGTFSFKTVDTYRVGQKGIIVGDACLVFPPWAGYGANQSMYGAASLAYALAEHHGNRDRALYQYESRQQILSRLLVAFVDGQGDFLSGPVASDPAGRSEAALAMMIAEMRRLAPDPYFPEAYTRYQTNDADVLNGSLEPVL